jgi:MerR family transcriptional regulator, redox-sensitive transcriptional activator SoxR
MSIGEVARRPGVRPSALRYYESIGVLPTPQRENGRRRYDGEVLRDVLDRLTVVRVAQQAGFTIS